MILVLYPTVSLVSINPAMIVVLYAAVSLVSINPEGSHNHPARDAPALAQGRLSLLLALEVAPTGRATADRHGAARIDPADERRKSALGRHASTANCSSSGLRSRSRASPNTWSNDGGHPARDGEPSCVTTRRTLPPWTCSLFQLSVSTCSMPSSLSGSTAETWSGSTSQQIRRQNGLHVQLTISWARDLLSFDSEANRSVSLTTENPNLRPLGANSNNATSGIGTKRRRDHETSGSGGSGPSRSLSE